MVETQKILFQITDENLETGMRGYPVGYCVTSNVDPEKGLFYMGRPVSTLASHSPEEVIYLLLHGKEPSPDDLKNFTADLQKRSTLKPQTIEHIRKLPKAGHPMKLFSAAILIAGMLEGVNDYRQDCFNIIAKMPEIAATVIAYHSGKEQKPSNPSLGYIENFTQMLSLNPDITPIFKLFNILHYDHGGGNLSCFTGKAIASGLEEMWGSISGAMNALAGPRHGKANQDSLQFVKDTLAALGPNATPDALKRHLEQKLASSELIFGFGHAVLRVEDPRATIFYEIASKKYPNDPLVKMALLLRSVTPPLLKNNPKISDPYPNVDAISGTLLSAAGFPHPEYYTVLFGLARTVGIARQIVYERLEARSGKGTPIVRPKYLFKPHQG